MTERICHLSQRGPSLHCCRPGPLTKMDSAIAEGDHLMHLEQMKGPHRPETPVTLKRLRLSSVGSGSSGES